MLTNKDAQLKALKAFFNPIFPVQYLDTLMNTIIQAAKAMGMRRSDVFHSFYYYESTPTVQPVVATPPSPHIVKIKKLKEKMGSWKKVAETLALSPPRVSEFIHGKASATSFQKIITAINAYEKKNKIVL